MIRRKKENYFERRNTKTNIITAIITIMLTIIITTDTMVLTKRKLLVSL